MNQAAQTVRSARKLPRRYGVIDQRIVSEGYLKRLSAEAVSLYVFLCVVADRDGRSWYSDGRLVQQIRTASLAGARRQLVEAGLIAWEQPVYTVLNVPETVPRSEPVSTQDGAYAAPDEVEDIVQTFRRRMNWG